MKKNLVRLFGSLLALLLLFHLSSCKDPVISDTGITSNPEDNINLSHMDSSTIVINTVQENALLSSGITTGVLGSMDDAYFGRTYAGVYAQCLLSYSGAIFNLTDSAPVVDSTVLYMPFVNDSSYYGRCSQPIDLLVYELNQDMQYGIAYTNRDAFSVYNQIIGRKNNYVPDLIDSFPVLGVNAPPQISINLSNSFGNKLLHTDSTSLSASSNFISYFKGFYVTTNTAKLGNGLMYFLLQSSKITLYYHTSANTARSFDFPVSAYSIAANHFDHTYSPQVNTALNTAANNKTAYIQSGGATKIKLQIPYLNRIVYPVGKDSISIAITKAELVVPIGDTFNYPPPQNISIYRVDDTLAIQPLNSYNNSGSGKLTTRLDNTGQPYLCYAFSLTEHVQKILNHVYNNNGFYLQYSYTVRGDRVIIYNDPAIDAKRIKLKLTYTKLK